MRGRSWTALLAVASLAACQGASGDRASASGSARGEAARGEGVLEKVFKPKPVVIPQGTALTVVLETTVSSASSRQGDLVLGKLAEDVSVGEKVVLPAGTEVRGRVTAAVPSGKVKGRARLAFAFDRVLYRGKETPISARTVDITAPKSHGRDAKVVAGGAGAGAVIGAIADGKKGAGIGALIGAGAGTGVVLATKGKEVQVPAGSRLSIKLVEAASL